MAIRKVGYKNVNIDLFQEMIRISANPFSSVDSLTSQDLLDSTLLQFTPESTVFKVLFQVHFQFRVSLHFYKSAVGCYE